MKHSVVLIPKWFSKPPHSAALPPLRGVPPEMLRKTTQYSILLRRFRRANLCVLSCARFVC